MAIEGLRLPTSIKATSVEEEVRTTVIMLRFLDLVDDVKALRTSLTKDFTKLRRLGEGRLYVRLSADVMTAQLIELANTLATERGFDAVFCSPELWVPGATESSLTEQELDGTTATFEARLVLHSGDECDQLLHFAGLSYDDEYRDKGQPTQLEKVEQERARLVAEYAHVDFDTCDQRDYLVWYIMDLLRGVPSSELVLNQGSMRIPRHGHRHLDGVSLVGVVYSYGGRAHLRWSRGGPDAWFGVGLSYGSR